MMQRLVASRAGCRRLLVLQRQRPSYRSLGLLNRSAQPRAALPGKVEGFRLSGDATSERGRRCFAKASSDGEEGTLTEVAAVAGEVDAIVVLAGGLTPSGGVPEWVEGRLDAAVDLSRRFPRAPILCTGGGTPHKPPILFETGHVNHESTVCADYLISKGVARAGILKETSSYDTLGNAYFSLVIHALPLEWRNVVCVTSAFHMPRARAAFEWIYGCGDAANAIALQFLSVPDVGMSAEALEARREREEASARALRRNAEEITTLSGVNTFLHQTHRCYAVARQDEWKQPTEADDLALKTY
mmetsp:Transcript_2412/g.6532  ORF Transcript_2412/g.6532 Transcript_2412/m.6532 type:complete len:301 (+) Transcript_2412:245-1147(+)